MDKLNLMASFIAVVEEGSFTAAAKRLGKTTALISTHVSQLEALLDVRLLTRSTRQLKITDLGRSYYEEALQLLDDLQSLEARVREEHQSLAGQLRITAPTTFGEQVVVPLLGKLLQQHPQLNVELMLNDRYVDLIAEGFDMAVRIGQLESSTLIARKIGSTRMALCASPAFLQLHGYPQSPAELANYPAIFDTNHRKGSQWQFQSGAETISVTPQIIIKVNSATAAVEMAKAGMALSYSPLFAVQDALAEGSLISLLDEYCQNDLPIQLLYSHRRHLSAKVAAVVKLFSALLAE